MQGQPEGQLCRTMEYASGERFELMFVECWNRANNNNNNKWFIYMAVIQRVHICNGEAPVHCKTVISVALQISWHATGGVAPW